MSKRVLIHKRAIVNDNATGVWSSRVGEELILVGPGANRHHLIVKRPGERGTFGMPTSWLDRREGER